MADAYLGEIRMFGGNYAPDGWVLCDGRTLSIDENNALYALIGATYGSDGASTFKVPDLRGRIPVHQGNGTGLTSRTLGASFGVENVTLTEANLPAHTHAIAAGGTASTNLPTGAYLADATGFNLYAPAATTGMATMDANVMEASGGASPVVTPFSNLMPGQCVSFIMATAGMYPTQD